MPPWGSDVRVAATVVAGPLAGAWVKGVLANPSPVGIRAP